MGVTELVSSLLPTCRIRVGSFQGDVICSLDVHSSLQARQTFMSNLLRRSVEEGVLVYRTTYRFRLLFAQIAWASLAAGKNTLSVRWKPRQTAHSKDEHREIEV